MAPRATVLRISRSSVPGRRSCGSRGVILISVTLTAIGAHIDYRWIATNGAGVKTHRQSMGVTSLRISAAGDPPAGANQRGTTSEPRRPPGDQLHQAWSALTSGRA